MEGVPADQMLYGASKLGDVETMRLAISGGARPDQADELGNTPLHYAANAGHAEAVHELLHTYHVPVNVANAAGDTPLHKAAARGHAGVVRALLAAGADPTLRNALGQCPADGAFDPAVKDALASADTAGVDCAALLGVEDDDEGGDEGDDE